LRDPLFTVAAAEEEDEGDEEEEDVDVITDDVAGW